MNLLSILTETQSKMWVWGPAGVNGANVEWDDDDASFTDFVVACHMDEMGVDHIATYDSHYQLFDVVTVPHIDFN